MAAKQPWTDYPLHAGFVNREWDTANFPFVVRWSVPNNDRLTRSVTERREFMTMAEAIAAYKRGFTGLSVDVVMYNGKAPGSHLDQLASRKAGKPTKWGASVPPELRAA